MEILFSFLIFILGLIVGSFLNCVIYRIEKNESFLKGRSFCPNCKHILSWQDLIPFFSFLFLKGKCRYCHQKISLQYPLVELFTGFIFLLISFNFLKHGLTLPNLIDFIFLLVISCFLILIFVYDLKHYLIPEKIIYFGIFLTLFYQVLNQKLEIKNLIFGILPSFLFLVIILISKEKWMGWGDFKLAVLIGILLGWPKIIISLFISFFFGAIIGIGLMIFGGKNLKSEVPFAPFLVSGTFLTIFLGDSLIHWYSLLTNYFLFY